MRLTFKFGTAIFLVGSTVCAGATDLAILRNGNSIPHERHQTIGAVTRLYLSDSASGYLEIPTDQIERFEVDNTPQPAPSRASHPVQSNLVNTTAVSSSLDSPAQKIIDRQSLDAMVNGAGQRHQIDPDFINSVIRAESGFNNRAVSRKGAQGLMQLMPRTASQLGVANSFDPNANVEGGTKYLRELLEKYNYDAPKALAAYNAGSRRVDQYHGVPPYFETQTYVAKIIRDYNRKKLAQNPSLAHKGNIHSSHSQIAKRGTPKSAIRKTAAEKPLAGTESASR
ncbi:MAG TPA: lytic transglycosylase domain-containing protein [Terriglobales bacterium]|nr:lytic transglycosylase domain-containing protein [Terriglobales bacterium]